MTEEKKTVDKVVDNTTPAANLPSVVPATTTVDNKQPPKWAFDGVGSGGTNGTTEAKGTYVAAPVHDVPAEVDPVLVTMLCWPRSHNSPEELAFTAWLKDYLVTTLHQTVITMHKEGAFSVTIPMDGDLKSTTLFSCHVDTVDVTLNISANRKKLTYDPGFGTIALDSQSIGNCLGADDSAGIWLMLKLIEAGTPGTYLFHRGEECGGVSAKAIAKQEAAWLAGFQCAIAFDRKDTGDIVTVQGGLRCASPKFATRLAGMLDAFGFQYQESLTGSYTDVKDYRHIIPEVVNLSCGYDAAHSRNETLDYAHLFALAGALPKVEWEALPIDRDPKAKDPTPAYGGYKQWKGSNGLFDDEDMQWGKGKSNGTKKKKAPLVPVGKLERDEPYDKGFDGMSWEELLTAVGDDPDWACEHIVRMMRHNAKLMADVQVLEDLMGL